MPPKKSTKALALKSKKNAALTNEQRAKIAQAKRRGTGAVIHLTKTQVANTMPKRKKTQRGGTIGPIAGAVIAGEVSRRIPKNPVKSVRNLFGWGISPQPYGSHPRAYYGRNINGRGLYYAGDRRR